MKTTRIVCQCPVSSEGYVTVPKGNILGRFAVALPDALQPTLQSSVIEMTIILSIDGVPVPVTVESEQFFVETSWR